MAVNSTRTDHAEFPPSVDEATENTGLLTPKCGDGEHKEVGATAGFAGSVLNLVNTVVGGGVLSLPFAFYASGVVMGVIFLYLVLGLSIYSMLLLVDCARLSGLGHKATYREVARAAYGKTGVLITDIALILACFGALCSYLVIIADMLVSLLTVLMGHDMSESRDVIIGVTVCVLFPLATMRHLAIYQYISFGALIAIGYFAFIVIYHSVDGMVHGSIDNCYAGIPEGCEVTLFDLSANFFRTIPIISFAYTCQMNFLTVYSELENPTEKRMRMVSYTALFICSTVYFLIGTFGYLTFFNDVAGNILLNYDDDDVTIIVARVAVMLVIFFSFPLMAHPTVNTLEDLFFSGKVFSWFRRIALVAGLCGAAVLIALLVDDISFIFGLTGATASTTIGFLLPAAFFMGLHPAKFFSAEKAGSIVLMVLGLIFMVASTAVTIIDEFGGEETVEPSPTPAVVRMLASLW